MSLANAGSLADLQRAFQDYLLASSDAFTGAVRDTKKADRTTLLDVYRDGYALRLIEVLTNDYPGLLAMAGPADFDLLARAYIAAQPSRTASVRWFGRHLADFMARTPPYSGSPAAIEMARFEWLLGEAFDSADHEPVTAAALMSLPPDSWETLRFTALPSLRRASFGFEVPQAWQRRDEAEPGDLDVAAATAPVPWMIWRPERVSHFRSLETDEAAMLDALVDGRPFPELCDAIMTHSGEDQAAARAAGLLRAWVEEGLIGFFSY